MGSALCGYVPERGAQRAATHLIGRGGNVGALADAAVINVPRAANARDPVEVGRLLVALSPPGDGD